LPRAVGRDYGGSYLDRQGIWCRHPKRRRPEPGRAAGLSPLFGGAPLGQGRDRLKRDNHTNVYGFRDEGDAFFSSLSEHSCQQKNLYIVCGDRHWPYHSLRRDGFEEFSVGALIDRNSRPGRASGDPESIDPEGLIVQPFLQREPGGNPVFLLRQSRCTALPGRAPGQQRVKEGRSDSSGTDDQVVTHFHGPRGVHGGVVGRVPGGPVGHSPR